VPLNEKGREITEEDDIFIDDPRQLVSFGPVYLPLLKKSQSNLSLRSLSRKDFRVSSC